MIKIVSMNHMKFYETVLALCRVTNIKNLIGSVKKSQPSSECQLALTVLSRKNSVALAGSKPSVCSPSPLETCTRIARCTALRRTMVPGDRRGPNLAK